MDSYTKLKIMMKKVLKQIKIIARVIKLCFTQEPAVAFAVLFIIPLLLFRFIYLSGDFYPILCCLVKEFTSIVEQLAVHIFYKLHGVDD